jgi:hypothetical protein
MTWIAIFIPVMLNNAGAMVGFYTDSGGNTDGFVANDRPLGIPGSTY